MPVFPIPEAQMEAVQADARRRAIRLQPIAANLEAATTLHDEGEFGYRGRRYRVRAVPFRAGLRLEVLAQELRRVAVEPVSEATTGALLWLLTEVARECWGLVRRPWWWRLLRRRNPFLDAEEEELAAMLRFFSRARTRSAVVTRLSVRAPAWLPQITRTHLRCSRAPTPAGWRPAAIRAAIATSGSASPGSATRPSAPPASRAN